MINRGEIARLAIKWQTTELNVRREYCQHLFLHYFYREKNTKNVYFKGGTALRIIYGSPRFSQDLDFAASFGQTKVIEEILTGTLAEIEREGIKIALLEAKTTTGGYLAIIAFQTSGQAVRVNLQISLRRKKENKGTLQVIVSDFMPAYALMSLPPAQLVNEKIQALLTRKKPRDFYDCYFMLRANLLSLQAKVFLPKVLKILKTTDLNFAKELRQFLPKSHWLIIKNFKLTLEEEIKRVL